MPEKLEPIPFDRKLVTADKKCYCRRCGQYFMSVHCFEQHQLNVGKKGHYQSVCAHPGGRGMYQKPGEVHWRMKK